MRLHQNFRTACLFGIAIYASLSGVALADNSPAWNTLSVDDRQKILRALDVEQSASAGVQNLRTETGAQAVRQAALTDAWFQQQRQGNDRSLRLVWQRSVNMLSVSENGLSLTRRF
jgi:hypothetical protein